MDEKKLTGFEIFERNSIIACAIDTEITRANEKHGQGPLASPIEVIAILVEELGEYAQAILQDRHEDARKELIQLCSVAVNHLRKTGPHVSTR